MTKVDGVTFACIVLSVFLTLVFPVLLTVVMKIKKIIKLAPVISGAAVYVVFQIVIRIPLLSLLASNPVIFDFLDNIFYGAMTLAVLGAVIEETGRFCGVKFLMHGEGNWNDGVAFGIGFGGIESISMVGMSSLTNLVYAVMLNRGTIESLTDGLGEEGVAKITETLTTTPAEYYLAGGMERVFSISLAMAFSVLMIYIFRTEKYKLIAVSVLCHVIIETPLTAIYNYFGHMTTEVFYMICAFTGVVFLQKVKPVLDKMDEGRKKPLSYRKKRI